MALDYTALRNLEVLKNLRGDREGSLIKHMDRCVTKMGSRRIAMWVQRPLKYITDIEKRQDAVEYLLKTHSVREDLKELMKYMGDLDRLASRIGFGNATPRDLVSLKNTLRPVPNITKMLINSGSKMLREIADSMPDVSMVVNIIENAITDEAGTTTENAIKDGYSDELDEIKSLKNDSKKWLMKYESGEKERTGIKSLKIGYNDVAGYYIEVTKANLSKVPDNYMRKQTLKNAERFTTEELQELQVKILSAEDRIAELEKKIYSEILNKVAEHIDTVRDVSDKIASVDALHSLAEVATTPGYVRPVVDNSVSINIKNGRHPVMDTIMSGEFIPNDTKMDHSGRMIILTGPNMAGKSTFMRQVALITIMAQTGSFVPADEARIGIVDRIYTRVGASDNILLGQSTFMVEMLEVANIINTATERSLILLDEIGRGTSTYDGLSIAWAVAEYIHNKIKARTVFATHYHQLIELERYLDSVKNYHITVKESKDGLIFIRKIMPGGMSESYGIQVAKLAGLREEIVKRAREILESAEKGIAMHRPGKEVIQYKLFSDESTIEKELRDIDVLNITPIEALNKLYELKRKYGL